MLRDFLAFGMFTGSVGRSGVPGLDTPMPIPGAGELAAEEGKLTAGSGDELAEGAPDPVGVAAADLETAFHFEACSRRSLPYERFGYA